MVNFKRILSAVLVCAVAAGFTASAAAEDYPSKPITLVVPWNPGGATDQIGRKIADILGRSGARIIIENVPGANGTIGLSRVARAKPDGYTVGIATSSFMAAVTQGITKLSVDDFTALNQTAVDQMVLIVPKSSPINSIGELVSSMKARNGTFSIAQSGSNNVNHVFAAMLAKGVGVDYVNVPYSGGAKVISDLSGNQIDAAVLQPSEVLGQLSGGMIKAIGVFSTTRISVLPEVQTFAENKINVFPPGALEQMSYLVAPAAMSPALEEKTRALFRSAIQSQEYKNYTRENGISTTNIEGALMQEKARAVQKSFDSVAPVIFKTQ